VDRSHGAALPFVTDDKVGARLAPSLVMVDVDIPHPTAGVKDFNFRGAGVVIDAERGWVLVDRDTVPVSLADIALTFAGAVRVPGRLVWLHPMHNVAIIAYDPDLVSDVTIVAAELVDRPLTDGEAVWQVGLDGDQRVVVNRTTVDEVDALYQAASGSARFRDLNLDTVRLADPSSLLGGVLTDKKGRVRALWASFLDPGQDERRFRGLQTGILPPWLLSGGDPAPYCFSGVELGAVNLSDAIDRGLPDADARAVVASAPDERRMLQVTRIMGGTPAADVLRGSDVIVRWDGPVHHGPLTQMPDLERASLGLCAGEAAQVTVLRDGQELTVSLTGVLLGGAGLDRAVSFAGLVLHDPHIEVALERQDAPKGPYLGWLWYGSPAYRHGLRPTRQLLAVNGTPTPDLATFLDLVRTFEDGEGVVLRTVNRQGREEVETLRMDLHYWPTFVLSRDAEGNWTREPVVPEATTP